MAQKGPFLLTAQPSSGSFPCGGDELASGTIVEYTPPDNYVVEWTDATTTMYL
eukprot:COSAG06_NODE_70372_length_192_cov_42.247312_1_plen_52_part_10